MDRDEIITRTTYANSQIKYMDIKGKKYAPVSEKVKAFRYIYPDGCLSCRITQQDENSVTMLAEAYDGDGKLIANAYASETRNASNINRTSMIENCVPLETQILTKRGWLFYYQVTKEDEALSLNLDTMKVEFTPIIAVNVFGKMPLVELSTSRFRAMCTPEHKWVVETQRGKIYKVETNKLQTNHRIVTNHKQEIEPSDEGKRLGWLMCDCEITKSKNGLPSTAYIDQCKLHNVEEISRLFPDIDPIITAGAKEHWLDRYEWVVPADRVREILGKYGIAKYDDLAVAMLNAPIEDVAGCYDAMMRADGMNRGFASTYLPLVEAVQIMCARLGLSTTFITERMLSNATKPIYTLGIKKTDRTCYTEIKTKVCPPHKVWCPTTQNGTWFMRQGSFVTLTSNCDTGAKGRALAFLNIGVLDGIASAEEVDRATKINDKTNGLHVCRRCGGVITDTKDTTGKIWKADDIAKLTLKQTGDCYCLFCLNEIKKAEV